MEIANSDNHAFILMIGRFEGEVGTIKYLVDQVKLNPHNFSYENCHYLINGGYPNWALLRMMMPIVESIGALLFDSGSSANLRKVLEKEFFKYNKQYKKNSYNLQELYRNSIMHQDEMRVIIDEKGKEIRWCISYGMPERHLEIEKDSQGIYIRFDLDAFYSDINKVLNELCYRSKKNEWRGIIKERYNKWTAKKRNDSIRSKFLLKIKFLESIIISRWKL